MQASSWSWAFGLSPTCCQGILSWWNSVFSRYIIMMMLHRLEVTGQIPLWIIVILLVGIHLAVCLAGLLGSHDLLPHPPVLKRPHHDICSPGARHRHPIFVFIFFLQLMLMSHQFILIYLCGVIEVPSWRTTVVGSLVVESLEVWGLMASATILAAFV